MNTLPDAHQAIARDSTTLSPKDGIARRKGHIAPGLGLGGLVLAVVLIIVLL